MRRLFIIGLVMAMAGCKKGKDDCTPGSKLYVFHPGKTISTQQGRVALVDGAKTVFEFKQTNETCPGVILGYISRSIFFELPSSVQNSFQISDSTGFANANAVLFTDAPVSSFFGTVPLTQGSLQGSRMGPGYWHIEGQIVLSDGTLDIDAHYREAD